MGKQECVSLAVVCDGIQDCLGGTEENNCRKSEEHIL